MSRIGDRVRGERARSGASTPRGLAASFKTGLVSWLLFPVYVWQGLAARRRIQRLLPPEGQVSGYCGAEDAGETAVKLLVIGEFLGGRRGRRADRGQLGPRSSPSGSMR